MLSSSLIQVLRVSPFLSSLAVDDKAGVILAGLSQQQLQQQDC